MEKEGVTYQSATELVCNQPKQYVDEFAERAAGSMLPPGGDIVELSNRLGGRVHYRNIFEEDADVDTIFVHGEQDFDIILPEHSTPRRDRFTIAHELGHYFLHSWQGQRPLRASRSGSDRAEWEANWFAAGFLMPQSLFRQAFEEKPSISWLAAKFDVSEHAARIRCQVLSLVEPE